MADRVDGMALEMIEELQMGQETPRETYDPAAQSTRANYQHPHYATTRFNTPEQSSHIIACRVPRRENS